MTVTITTHTRFPLGFDAGDGNLYRYAHNDPTNRVDPTGTMDGKLDPIKVIYSGMELGTLRVSWEGPTIFAAFLDNVGKFKTLGDAAKAIKADHFNWFQVVTAATDTVIAANTKRRCKIPHIDPPPGGTLDDDLKPTAWADDRPWYLNEGKIPPAGTPEFSVAGWLDVETQQGDIITSFSDRPTRVQNAKLSFKTWLVAVDADGKLVAFLDGFSWDWVRSKGKVEFTNVKPITDKPADVMKLYQNLLKQDGFVK
jgi:hypothetical protein